MVCDRGHKTLSWSFIYLFLRVWDVGLCGGRSVLTFDDTSDKWWWISLWKLVPGRGKGGICLATAVGSSAHGHRHSAPSAVLVHPLPPHPKPQSSPVQTLLILCYSAAAAARHLLSFSHGTLQFKSLPLLHFVFVCVLTGMCGCIFI